MSRSVKRTRREPAERPLPPRVVTPDPEVDEVTAARLKRAFPIEEYPGRTRKDLVVTPSGRVLLKRVPGDTLVVINP